jgi:hypothetical protein
MHTNRYASRLLDAGRASMHGSRPWAWLAAIAAAGTTAAYLTAAASPVPSRHAAGTDTAAAAQPLLCGPAGYFIQCYSPGQYRVAYGAAPLLRCPVSDKSALSQ